MAVDLCSGGRGVATSLLGPSWEGEKPPWGTCSGERGREEQGCPGPAGRRRSGEALELKCSQRFLKGKKKIPSLHSVNTAALARRVTGSDGLCVPPFSPRKEPQVFQVTLGRKPWRPTRRRRAKTARSLAAELARGGQPLCRETAGL